MSDLHKIREEVKKNVRALLISAPKGLTPNQIENDYRDMLGHQLPFRDLGYNSLLDLLRALPDCVQFTYDHGHMILKGVADETTIHIASLVSRQRSKRRTGKGRGSGRMSYMRRIPPPVPRGPIKPLIAEEPSVPAHIRNKVKELLTVYSNGLLGSSFNAAFARRFGHHIDFKAMGFKSFAHLINAMTGLVRVEHLDGGGFRIFGKTDTPRKLTQPKEVINPRRQDNVFQNDIPARERKASDSPSKKTVLNQRDNQLQKDKPIEKASTEPSIFAEKASTEPSIFVSESKTEDLIDTELKNEIRSLLQKRPAGMWAARLSHEYKNATKKDLPLKELGFYSVIELISAMSDVVSIERPNDKGDWLLHDVNKKDKTPENSKSKEMSPKTNPSKKVTDEKLLYNVWLTLSHQPNGVFLPSFQALYLQYTKTKLYPLTYGFNDLLLLLRAMPLVVKIEERLDGHIVLHANSAYQPPLSMFEDDEEPEKIPLSWKQFSVPPDAVGGGVSYTDVQIPRNEDMMEVYLASVVSPSNFYIQIKSDETSLPLDILMDALEKIYCYPEGDQYMMPDSMMTVGQVCAAIYQQDGNWHRAVITGVRDCEFVEIMYIDYGNTATVPKTCLRLLKSIFLHLPAQAVKARLANIQPTKDGWTRVTRDRILELCRDKPLIAWVVQIEDDTLSLCLCDTSSDEDIHLNDLLVVEGHALFAPENLRSSTLTMSNTCTVPSQGVESESTVPSQTVPPCKPHQDTDIPDQTSITWNSQLQNIGKALASVDPQQTETGTTSQLPGETESYDKSMWTMGSDDDDLTCMMSPEDLELVEQMNREIEAGLNLFDDLESNSDTQKKPRYVKVVNLGGIAVAHIINHEGQPYLLRGEISSYLWEVDLLDIMLRKSRVQNVKKVILAQKNHQELFEDIKSHKIEGSLQGGDVNSFLTLYHLSSVPKILRVFDCKKGELANYFEEELKVFDKEDGYWKGEDYKIEDEAEPYAEDDVDDMQNYDLDDLKLMLQAMQFRRMRTLQSMISDPDTYLVDELQDIELEMGSVRDEIKLREQGTGVETGKVRGEIKIREQGPGVEIGKVRDELKLREQRPVVEVQSKTTQVAQEKNVDKLLGQTTGENQQIPTQTGSGNDQNVNIDGKSRKRSERASLDKDEKGQRSTEVEGKGQSSTGVDGKGERSTGVSKKTTPVESVCDKKKNVTNPKARIEPMCKGHATLSASSSAFHQGQGQGLPNMNSTALFEYPPSFQQQVPPSSVYVVPPASMPAPTYMPAQLMQSPFVGQYQYGSGLYAQSHMYAQQQVQPYNTMQGFVHNQMTPLPGHGRGKAQLLGFSSNNTGHHMYY